MSDRMNELVGAMETALNAMTPPMETAWENQRFAPTPDVPYQRVNLLPAEPDDPTYGGGLVRENGMLQLTLCYPLGTGTKDVLTRAAMIQSTFERGKSYQNGLTTVQFSRTAIVLPAIIDGDRYCVPVRIRYFANIEP